MSRFVIQNEHFFEFLVSIHTVSFPFLWVNSLPLSCVSFCSPLLSCCISSLPPFFFLCISNFLFYAMHAFAGGLGHKLFCWLNICSLIVYPFTPSRFLSISSSLRLRSHPPFPFPASIPTASEFPNLSPPPFYSVLPPPHLPHSGRTVAQCWVVLLKLDDVLAY